MPAASISVGGGAPAVITNSPVELQVTNLDQSVDQKDMKMLIAKMFRTHVGVMHVSTFFQSDGNLAACVRFVKEMQRFGTLKFYHL